VNGLNLTPGFLTSHRVTECVERFLAGATGAWAAVATSGTVAALNERGGGVSITTQAADNAEGTLTLSAKPLVVAANKPISFGAMIDFAEAATDDGNVFVGMTSEAVATALGDNGAGPPADYSGVGFHKLDGGLNWIAEFSNSTTQKTQELTADGSLDSVVHAAGSATTQLLEIDVLPKTATLCDVVFKIDDVCVAKFMDQVFTSMIAMAPVVIVKAGGSSAEVIKVRLIRFAQVN
jgi:hypothetical protein